MPRKLNDPYFLTESAAQLVVVGGNELFREGVAHLLKAEGGYEVVGIGKDLATALAGGNASQASVLILEVAGITESDRALLPGILALGTLKVVAVEPKPSPEYGAFSISQDGSKAALLKLVKDAVGTRKNLVRESRASYGSRLTSRELDVAKLVAQGHPNRRISEMLELQEQSVKNLVSVIMRKLQCENRVQVALKLTGIRHEEAEG